MHNKQPHVPVSYTIFAIFHAIVLGVFGTLFAIPATYPTINPWVSLVFAWGGFWNLAIAVLAIVRHIKNEKRIACLHQITDKGEE